MVCLVTTSLVVYSSKETEASKRLFFATTASLILSDKTNYYLGVDGGGSKTKAVLVAQNPHCGEKGKDEKNTDLCQCLLGQGVVAGSNPLSVGWEVAFERIEEAVRLARKDAGPLHANVIITKAVFAIAGAANTEVKQRLTGWAEAQDFADQVEVVDDTAPLLADRPRGLPALGVIAGTGSVVLVRDRTGATSHVGGWGYLIDDAGSGYAIGRRALREAVRSHDRQESKEPITSALLQAMAVDSIADIKQLIYNAANPRETIASLAKAVTDLAEQEDPTSLRLLQIEATLLANEIAIGCDRLKSEQPTAEGLVLNLGGSLLQKSKTYRKSLAHAIKQQGLPIDSLRLAPDGACGCARLASQSAH